METDINQNGNCKDNKQLTVPSSNSMHEARSLLPQCKHEEDDSIFSENIIYRQSSNNDYKFNEQNGKDLNKNANKHSKQWCWLATCFSSRKVPHRSRIDSNNLRHDSNLKISFAKIPKIELNDCPEHNSSSRSKYRSRASIFSGSAALASANGRNSRRSVSNPAMANGHSRLASRRFKNNTKRNQ